MKKLIDDLSVVTVFFLVLIAVSSALPEVFSLGGEAIGNEGALSDTEEVCDSSVLPSPKDSECALSDNPEPEYTVTLHTVEETLPRKSVRIACSDLPYGVETVSAEGVDGIVIHKYQRITFADGSFTDIPSESEVVREPSDRVVLYGDCRSTPFNEFLYPTEGRLTSGFGYRTIFGVRSFHHGIDIANDEGTPISASDSGTVILACNEYTYGNYILIDHHNGFVTCYAHLQSFEVEVGDEVVRGQVIGSMGHTGRVTGNHLHFEIRLDGTRVDPQLYLSDTPKSS